MANNVRMANNVQHAHAHPYKLCGSNYVDIDECFDDIDGCAQQCTDTDGSYNCSCGSGYTLASDDHGCDGKF